MCQRTLELLAGAFVELAQQWAEREAQPAGRADEAADGRFERLAGRLGHAIVDQIEGVLAAQRRGVWLALISNAAPHPARRFAARHPLPVRTGRGKKGSARIPPQSGRNLRALRVAGQGDYL